MKIALVGNQNSGKTTLFNLLTGSNQKIGNWPGVTIERKIGTIRNTKHEIVDLPGIYSLSPYTIEEEISRKYVFEEKPDLIINIIDATSIERSLYLTTQLLELDTKVIIAFEENVKPLACNKTNAASITKALKSRFLDEWVGKKIQLYRSKNIKFGSESGIWGIRVRDYAPKVEGEKCHCSVCGKEIAKKLYDGTIAKYGKPYCSEECYK